MEHDGEISNGSNTDQNISDANERCDAVDEI